MAVGIIAVLMVFGLPIYAIKRWYDHKELKLRSNQPSTELLEMKQEQKLLMDRIETLESTVHSADYELNQKLAKLELSAKKDDHLLASKSNPS